METTKMKKIITAAVLGIIVQAALSAPVPEKTTDTSLDHSVPQEYYRRFVALDTIDRQGFYWLDSTNGHLRKFVQSQMEWEDQGIRKGMETGPKGTYMLLVDNRGGVYVLNTSTGQGWWFDGSIWEAIGKDGTLRNKTSGL
jgi:hypothetical protein